MKISTRERKKDHHHYSITKHTNFLYRRNLRYNPNTTTTQNGLHSLYKQALSRGLLHLNTDPPGVFRIAESTKNDKQKKSRGDKPPGRRDVLSQPGTQFSPSGAP